MKVGWLYKPSPWELLWALVVYSWSAGPVCAAVTQTVQVTGTGVIIADDLASAFEQAKKAALREAVEQAAGTLVRASTRVEAFVAVSDATLLQTTGLVRKYTVLSQAPMDAHTYQVTLEAEVDLGYLHQQLEAKNLLIEAAGDPPVLCLGREILAQGANRSPGWGVVAEELEKGLKAASTRFSLLEAGGKHWDDTTALQLARSLGAEVVVIGKATIRPLPSARIPAGGELKDLGISSAAAEIEVKLVWVDSGDLVAVLTESSRAAGGSFEAAAHKAARQGTARIAPELVKRLLKDWQEKAYSGRSLQLEVQASVGQLRRFERDFPTHVGGIDQLHSRSFAGGIARYEALAHSEGFQVARELSAKGIGDLNVEILRVTGNTLKLKLSD